MPLLMEVLNLFGNGDEMDESDIKILMTKHLELARGIDKGLRRAAVQVHIGFSDGGQIRGQRPNVE